MGDPLKAIPQVITDDKKLADVLNALKYVIDVREGRVKSDGNTKWLTEAEAITLIKAEAITLIKQYAGSTTTSSGITIDPVI